MVPTLDDVTSLPRQVVRRGHLHVVHQVDVSQGDGRRLGNGLFELVDWSHGEQLRRDEGGIRGTSSVEFCHMGLCDSLPSRCKILRQRAVTKYREGLG